MVEAAIEQEVLEGEVVPPEQITQRFFKTLDGLTDFIRIFNVTRGGFAFGHYPEVGECFLLEYPTTVQE